MSLFFVHNVFNKHEITILDQSVNSYQIGFVNTNGKRILFYSETTEKGGTRFGYENYKGLLSLLSVAKNTDNYCAIVLFLSSVGADLTERTRALDYYAEIFKQFVEINKKYLIISVVSGNCVGGSAYLASLSDIVLFSIAKGNLCITGPKIVEKVLGTKCEKKQLGGYETQSSAGTISKGFSNAAECRLDIEYFLDARIKKKTDICEPNRRLKNSDSVFNNRPYNMMGIIEGIIDNNSDKQIYSGFGKSIITTLARLEGYYIGVLASQPLFGWGAIDADAAEKGTRFIRLCSKMQIPLLIIADVPSFLPGKDQEIGGIQWKGADFLREMILFNEKKVSLIVHKCYGGAYIAMNSINTGATAVYAWKDAQIGIMGINAEKELNGIEQSVCEKNLSAKANLEFGSITEIIDPTNTRKKIFEAIWGDYE